MKKIFLTALACVAFSSTMSRANDDVAVVGPNGEALLVYKEGDDILIQECPQYTVIETPEQGRKDCQVRWSARRTNVNLFRKKLTSFLAPQFSAVLYPLTEQEVIEYYEQLDLSPIQVENLEKELARINSFAAKYGLANVDQIHLNEVKKALDSHKSFVATVRKVNGIIDFLMRKIMDDKDVYSVSYGSGANTFNYTALKNFDSIKYTTCGLLGTLEERKEDCRLLKTTDNRDLDLISIDQIGRSIHQDNVDKTFYGDIYVEPVSLHTAKVSCESMDLGKLGKKWKLPSVEDITAGMAVINSLPNNNFIFWTSSQDPERPGNVKVYNGKTHYFQSVPAAQVPTSQYQFRCISK